MMGSALAMNGTEPESSRDPAHWPKEGIVVHQARPHSAVFVFGWTSENRPRSLFTPSRMCVHV